MNHPLDRSAAASKDDWMEVGVPGLSPARIPITGLRAIKTIEAAGSENLLPAWTYHECFRLAAALDPKKPAIIFLPDSLPGTAPRTLSFAETLCFIEQAANLFRSIAGREQAVVSVLAPLLPEALIAMWGGAIAGVTNPINPFLEISHIAGIMNAGRSNILVTATPAHGSGAWNRLSELVKLVPTLRAVLVIDATSPADQDFLTSVRRQREDLAFTPDPDPDRVSGYFHTGGTTAAPKLVRHTQRGQLLNAWISGAHMGPARNEVIGHGMPNFHVGGAILLALRSLVMGQTLLTLTPDGFRDRGVVREFWNIALRYGMTSLLNAPTSAAMMLANPDAKSDGHSIRTFTVGGGAMPRSLAPSFSDRFGIALREIWGMTECQGILSSNPWGETPPRIGSVGLLNPFHRVVVGEIEDGRYHRECEPGEKGVLAVTGPCVTPGYLNLQGSSSPFVRQMPDGGDHWVNSGDLASIDADGYIWLYGREKDIIVRGGHNIEPSLVEEVLNRHPAVHVAAAVGQPDALKGELPIAYVQLQQGKKATPNELLALCKSEVAERAAVPIEVVIIDEVPVTAVGKIFKPALRLDATRRIVFSTAEKVLRGETGVTIDVMETKTRIRTEIHVPPGPAAGATAARLRDAFAGFHFETVIIED